MNKINVPCLYLYPDKCRQKLKNTIDYNNKKNREKCVPPAFSKNKYVQRKQINCACSFLSTSTNNN